MTRTYSPAALELMAAGITLTQIAERLNVTTAAVSLWLNGRRRPPEELLPTLIDLAGHPTALTAYQQIPKIRDTSEEAGQ